MGKIDPAASLGLTYIRITPALAADYDLKADSGLMVTEVAPGGPMDIASVHRGDVIPSCSGIKMDE